MSNRASIKRANLQKKNSFILANQNESLTRYIENIKQKQAADEDYAKWDLTKPLPKLPLPELNSTLEKYLRCVKPIISESAYINTEKIIKEFAKPGGDGEKLQKMLITAAVEKDNWAYDWWIHDFYMLNKQALPQNSNPGMVFPQENFTDKEAHLKFTARLISGIMDYKLVIDAEILPVDRLTCREKGQPLCMEQYNRLFKHYRVPGEITDKLIDSTTLEPLALEPPEHIIVISQNQVFVLDVVLNSLRLNEDQLYHQLKRIKCQSEEEHNTVDAYADVGFLTSLPRNQWAEARNELMKESTNQECLDMIERCIFIMCLDKKVTSESDINLDLKIEDNEDRKNENKDIGNDEIDSATGSSKFLPKMSEQALQMVHGCNSQNNSGNRWFDKMQFIVGEDGVCGINYEHSAAEGIVVIELSEHLSRYISEKRKIKLQRTESICDLPMPKKLRWEICDKVTNWIEYAKTSFDKEIAFLDMTILKFNKFGKEFPKKIKMSPDSFIQLSLQLAYYKCHGQLCSTYESASTRRFRRGRVDNIRANSCEALDWVKSMDPNSGCKNKEKMSLFRKAVQYQTDLMVDTILGNGMDCHINTLKTIANENNLGHIDFIQDESFAISNHFKLSTSQIPTSFEGSLMCYGPVVTDGYGCGYNPKQNYTLFAISSNKSCNETSTEKFANALESGLLEIYDLFNSGSEILA